MAKKVDTVISE